MGYTITNRTINLMGTLNVVFGDVTLTVGAQELKTGLKHVVYFHCSQDKKGQISAVYNSDDGVQNSKNGSMHVSGGLSLVGAGNIPSQARFMAIGI